MKTGLGEKSGHVVLDAAKVDLIALPQHVAGPRIAITWLTNRPDIHKRFVSSQDETGTLRRRQKASLVGENTGYMGMPHKRPAGNKLKQRFEGGNSVNTTGQKVFMQRIAGGSMNEQCFAPPTDSWQRLQKKPPLEPRMRAAGRAIGVAPAIATRPDRIGRGGEVPGRLPGG